METIPTYDLPKAADSVNWCMDISLTKHDDWMTPLVTAATHLVQAIASKNIVDIHTMQAMVQLLPVFVTGPPSYSIEDTYVHNCTVPILKPIFACIPLLRIE
ncbi:hypothetical protein RMATCC62417_14980 [Rhizopus microsporus]|nr:hypothetical protein RMATCC62417_14980 [Rhizopus microsporus]